MKLEAVRSFSGLFAVALASAPAPSLAEERSPPPRAVDEPSATRLPSLEELREAARASAPEVQRARLLHEQESSTSSAELLRLLPSVSATAGYTRNQYEIVAAFPGQAGGAPVTFSPLDQWDATFRLDVPLIDFGLWRQIAAARRTSTASEIDVAVRIAEIDEKVTRAYYGYVAGRALERSTKRALEVAEENLRYVSSRVESGLASEVDAARARAEIEQRRQDVAGAELSTKQAGRSLERLTGITVRGDADLLSVAPPPEAPLAEWVERASRAPTVQAALVRVEAARARSDAELGAYLPKIAGFASERFTNAAGFSIFPAWAVGLTATLRLDFAAPAALSASRTRVDVASAEVESTRRSVREQIANAWDQIESYRVRLGSAEAQLAAAEAAASVAKARYAAGTGSQIELVTANRDVLTADVNLVRARADLALARAVLRILAGGAASAGS